MDWKHLLYEYVQRRNRMEADASVAPLLPLVGDSDYLNLQIRRLERVDALRRERGIRPLQFETRLKIDRAVQVADGLTADLVLLQKQHYRIGQHEYIEEKKEKEQVRLTGKAGDWRIAAVSVAEPEAAAGEPNGGNDAGSAASEVSGENTAWFAGTSLPLINGLVYSPFGAGARKPRYDRSRAVAYAEKWWNSANPEYVRFGNDCTNYVSQCLFAGGAPMNYTGKRESGWWYQGMSGKRELWSYSWSVANSLLFYLLANSGGHGLRGRLAERPEELHPGDVIFYCWKGDGRFGHSTIVTAKAADGMPLVNAHTVSSRRRYWDYRDSYAWTERTEYRLVRIEVG